MLSPAAMEINEFIMRVARVIVDKPDEVVVNILESGTMWVIELTAAPSDIGKVIGREGRMAQALRVLLTALSTKLGKKAVLQIIEK
jgi:predicted RNA-binding protein YlqC (UPF0109 family)